MTLEISSDTSPRCELFNTFLRGPDKANAVEIASAITIEVQPILKELCETNTTLYIPAMPNKLGDGDVASNFRYKHDKDINNDVVKKVDGSFDTQFQTKESSGSHNCFKVSTILDIEYAG